MKDLTPEEIMQAEPDSFFTYDGYDQYGYASTILVVDYGDLHDFALRVIKKFKEKNNL